MTGSGMQQARDLRAEETIAVVQNHEGGTGLRSGIFATEACGDARGSGRPAGSVEGYQTTNPKGGGRRNPTRTTGNCSGGEPKTRGSARFRDFARRNGVGVTQPEDLEGPRGNA
jgi:hypothetical protein